MSSGRAGFAVVESGQIGGSWSWSGEGKAWSWKLGLVQGVLVMTGRTRRRASMYGSRYREAAVAIPYVEGVGPGRRPGVHTVGVWILGVQLKGWSCS
jgi:hypothetical protein